MLCLGPQLDVEKDACENSSPTEEQMCDLKTILQHVKPNDCNPHICFLDLSKQYLVHDVLIIHIILSYYHLQFWWHFISLLSFGIFYSLYLIV